MKDLGETYNTRNVTIENDCGCNLGPIKSHRKHLKEV